MYTVINSVDKKEIIEMLKIYSICFFYKEFSFFVSSMKNNQYGVHIFKNNVCLYKIISKRIPQFRYGRNGIVYICFNLFNSNISCVIFDTRLSKIKEETFNYFFLDEITDSCFINDEIHYFFGKYILVGDDNEIL